MNMKKIALIGVLALVVIGCVLAAGCTSQVNTNPDQVNPASGDTYIPIINGSNSNYFAENLSKIKTYLTLDKNGGNRDGYAEITLYEDKCHTFTPATRTGYLCTGYYNSPTEGVLIIDPFGSVSPEISLDSYQYLHYSGTTAVWAVPDGAWDESKVHPYYITLYAYWKVPEIDDYEDIEVTLDGNGGSDGKALYWGYTWRLSPSEKYGSQCTGYYTEKTGGIQVFNGAGNLAVSDDELVSLLNSEIEDGEFIGTLTLYAHWAG